MHPCPYSVSLVKDRAILPGLHRQPCTPAGCPGGRCPPLGPWVLSDLVSTCHVHYSRPYPLPGKHRPLTLQPWRRVLGPVLAQGSQDMEWGVSLAPRILAMLPVP